MTFDDLQLVQPLTRALEGLDYKTPTEIQAKAIPFALRRRDILGTAQTGTGKTAAFALPIIQMIYQRDVLKKNPRCIRALILTPTRELAIQIGENIQEYAQYTGVKHTVIYGGVKQHQQVKKLEKGVHILVATPGRLLDLMGQGYISLDDIRLFVLDEADRMLDMGFIHDIKKIIKVLPEKRQSLFFSATLPDSITDLSRRILTDPIKVETAPVSSAADTVQQYVYYTNKSHKNKLLLDILDTTDQESVLLFSRTKHGADRIARFLNKQKISALAIHGNKTQNQRQRALKLFKDRELQVLVATDIAARGIDIDQLAYVVNYDVPNESETYVHRIGRSGRAGASGVAISICEPEENAYVKDIEKLIRKKIEVVRDHDYPQTDKPMNAEEKKAFNKEKMRRKQEFFANRKKKRHR